MKPKHTFFNAHHSPVGAFASFTLGYPGAKGGLGLELAGPADESVYVGVETRGGGRFQMLPFYTGMEDEAARYDIEKRSTGKKQSDELMTPFSDKQISREFGVGTDSWSAGDLTFTIYSPPRSVPDPKRSGKTAMMAAICPAVLAELTVDNTKGKKPRRAVFGFTGSDPRAHMRRIDDVTRGAPVGIAMGRQTAIASDTRGAESWLGFGAKNILRPVHPDNLLFGLGRAGMIGGTVSPGKRKTFRYAICFFREGIVTTGMDASYYYTRYWNTIEDVARYALANAAETKRDARKADKEIERAKLSDDQRFMLAHAIRSYYGSSEFLQVDGDPFWVVNEGQYRMMNTFDLTVDQLFYEMRKNPWTVANELDWFVKRFSYTDRVHFPGEETEYAGGISFTHDMGVANAVSRRGWSSYELTALDGCFSHMTHEQLVNWVLCASVYIKQTGDTRWRKENLPVFGKCLRSMLRRDHPMASKRNGIMSLDSSRCRHGAEITTYDSLDQSLGQARNNLYMGLKCWASYVALEDMYTEVRQPRLAKQAGAQADRAAATIAEHLTEEGYIPAVMGEDCDARIIPAIEGLVFPHVLGLHDALAEDGRFGPLIQALRTHLKTVLVPGTCLFEDGGWKLSSTSENSWLSKIYLSQFVARRILGLPWGKAGRAADTAHVNWLLHPQQSYYAWSDQCISGVPKGSLYYPRGVTSILWLEE